MKVSYDAQSPKQGMTLAELADYVTKAQGLAESNNTPLENASVKVQINFSGGIKQLIAEV